MTASDDMVHWHGVCSVCIVVCLSMLTLLYASDAKALIEKENIIPDRESES